MLIQKIPSGPGHWTRNWEDRGNPGDSNFIFLGFRQPNQQIFSTRGYLQIAKRILKNVHIENSQRAGTLDTSTLQKSRKVLQKDRLFQMLRQRGQVTSRFTIANTSRPRGIITASNREGDTISTPRSSKHVHQVVTSNWRNTQHWYCALLAFHPCEHTRRHNLSEELHLQTLIDPDKS